MMKWVRVGILFFLTVRPLHSLEKINLKLIGQFFLEQKFDYLALPEDIAVDEEENIYVSDPKFHHIKMYDKKGHLVKIIGQKGGGPTEFASPWTIDYENGKLFIKDVGLKKYIILNRGLNNDFKELHRFFYLVDSHSFVVQNNRIISNDYFVDKTGKDFRGIILDFSGNVIKALMPIPYSQEDGWNRITSSKSHVDVGKNGDIFFAKEREIKILKFSKEGNPLRTFGRTPSFFRPCKITRDFEKAVFTSDPDRKSAWDKWYSSFSWVSGLFVFEVLLGIVIRNFNEKLNKWEYCLQYYGHDGRFLNENLKLENIGTLSSEMMMDSNHKDRIYFLEMIEGEEPSFRFSKYQIVYK